MSKKRPPKPGDDDFVGPLSDKQKRIRLALLRQRETHTPAPVKKKKPEDEDDPVARGLPGLPALMRKGARR